MKDSSSDNISKVINISSQLGININLDQAKKLISYMSYILDCNQYINLTAITNEDEFITKHLIDSMVISRLEEYIDANTVIDIGTGAGFPGIPLAVLSGDKQFLLVDSLLKRIKIVNDGINLLELKNVAAVHARGEALEKKTIFKNGADLVIARAVANMGKLAKYTLPNVKKGGFLIALKGSNIDSELQESQEIIKKLGGRIIRVQDLSFGELRHNAVVCKKIN